MSEHLSRDRNRNTPANINLRCGLHRITRGPIAFIGSGVLGGVGVPEDTGEIFQLDVGSPTGLCKEGPEGIFSRNWSNGRAQLDCNRWESELAFPSLQTQR